ncbi:MAG: hypothetical protein AAFN74_26325 [Myxococcota bacterium]
MIVRVRTADASVEILEPETLNRFHVQSDGALDATVSALGDLGRAAEKPDHVWIQIEGLRQRTLPSVDEGWSGRFDEMIRFAAKHGWVDTDQKYVMAHVES